MIDWINTMTVSVSMAVDCMTIGAADGVQHPEMKKRKIFFVSFIFGIFQGSMPIIGYFIGFSFRDALEKYIPWIAFGLLSLLGIKSIVSWIIERVKKKKGEEEEEKKELTIPTILLQGIATSIDALCIGFIYLSYPIPEAMLVFGIIGVVTFALSVLAIFLGRLLGKFLENWAELISGICFILVGLKILLESIL